MTQRTRELGVRMALGADAGDTLRLVLGRSMLLVAGGTLCGLVASFAITRVIGRTALRRQPARSDRVRGRVVAARRGRVRGELIPARRATRVDPIVALRVQ